MRRLHEHALQNWHGGATRPDVAMPTRGVLMETIDKSRRWRAETLRTVAEIRERERRELAGARAIVEQRIGTFDDVPIGGRR